MRILSRIAVCLALAGSMPAGAESSSSLDQAFAIAWQRHPAAVSAGDRQRALAANIAVAEAWTPEPPAIEVGGRSDRFNRDRGAGDVELGVVVPLWLPGQRDGSRQLARAGQLVLDGRLAALRLQLAGELRQAWWQWQLAREDAQTLAAQVEAAARLRDDVKRRVKAGELAPADMNLADGALAALQADVAEADVQSSVAAGRLAALLGEAPQPLSPQAEAAISDPLPMDWLAQHPRLLELNALAEQAARRQQLARTQRRNTPELIVATRRERAASGDPIDQSWSLGLRLPLASSARQDATLADAGAERIEAEVSAVRERERLLLDVRHARAAEAAVQLRLQASEQRERLARENLLWYEKAFRLGESDLPTRLRVAGEAFAAARAVLRARLQLAASISATRQALGLLPE